MAVRKAMILAAGRGERLRPLTDTVPKPLIRVGGLCLIEHHLHALATANYCDIVINIAHLGGRIRDQLGDGARYGVKIRYSEEPEGALETAGGIRQALPLLGDDTFLVVNGDIRTDFQFENLELSDIAMMHLVMVDNPAHHPEGDFCLDDAAMPRKLMLKSAACQSYTFSGIGLYRTAVFSALAPGRAALAPLIHSHIKQQTATGQLLPGRWIDVGDHQRLAEARMLE